MAKRVRVNVGCGATPTSGWINLDNSPTVRFAGWSRAIQLLGRFRILSTQQVEFARVARMAGIRWASATKLPLPDHSVDVVYSSHMMEHLTRTEARAFLVEVRRVLVTGGVIRLALPDLRIQIDRYLSTRDADTFVDQTRMTQDKPRGAFGRVRIAIVGPRNHLWMYDGASASKLLSEVGFTEVAVVGPGVTRIPEPGPLALREREDESVYIEGCRP